MHFHAFLIPYAPCMEYLPTFIVEVVWFSSRKGPGAKRLFSRVTEDVFGRVGNGDRAGPPPLKYRWLNKGQEIRFPNHHV